MKKLAYQWISHEKRTRYNFIITSLTGISLSSYVSFFQPTCHTYAAPFIGTNATNSFQTTPVGFTIENASFKNPVWVDVMTGSIYEIPKNQWTKTGTSCTFTRIPFYDAPVSIAEKLLL